MGKFDFMQAIHDFNALPEDEKRRRAKEAMDEYEAKLDREDMEFHERMVKAVPHRKPGPVPTYTGMGDYTADEIVQMLQKGWEKQFAIPEEKGNKK